jgi:hypothetical protein
MYASQNAAHLAALLAVDRPAFGFGTVCGAGLVFGFGVDLGLGRLVIG